MRYHSTITFPEKALKLLRKIAILLWHVPQTLKFLCSYPISNPSKINYVITDQYIILGNTTRVKLTTIMAIDLNTDKIIHKYEIPNNIVGLHPGLASVTVDVTKNTCDDAYLYLPDLSKLTCSNYYLAAIKKEWEDIIV